jgi:hypothetical protein
LILPIAVTPGNTAGAPLLPAAVAAQFGPSSLPFKEDLYFGKLDFEPTDQDRFVLAAKVRQETQETNVGLITRKLTFNLGVRWDYEQTPVCLDYLTPANVVAAINSQDPFAQAGVRF